MNYKKIATANKYRIYYSHIGGDSYRFLCSECGSSWVGTKKDLIEYKRFHHCPKCFSSIKTRDNDKYDESGTSIYYEKEYHEGYLIEYWVNNSILYQKNPILVYRITSENTCEYRMITIHYVMNVGYRYYYVPSNSQWVKKRYHSYARLSDMFINANPRPVRTKREEVEFALKEWENAPIVKDNQIKMFKDNPICFDVVNAIIGFNITDYKTIRKCLNYILGQFVRGFEEAYKNKLTSYDLEYLASQNISIIDYIDYLGNMRFVGLKNKHPKNFRITDYDVAELAQEMRECEHLDEQNKKMGNLCELYPSTEFVYNKTKYYIVPFKTSYEISDIAKEFHNCIRTYIDKYINRECVLYKCYTDKGNIACIEYSKGNIRQVRGKYNKNVKEEKKIVKTLLNALGGKEC